MTIINKKINKIESALKLVLFNSNNYGMAKWKWKNVENSIYDAFNSLNYLRNYANGIKNKEEENE